MKKRYSTLLVLILSAMFGLTGCAQKPKVSISFDPFKPNPAILQKSGTIYLAGVTDARKNKKMVGKIIQSGKPVTRILTDDSIDRWFADALVKALDVEGCKVVRKPVNNSKVAQVKIRIDQLEALLDRSELTKENLTATAKVTLFIKQGNVKITKHVGLTQKKWVPPFSGEGTVKSYLQETLEQLVESVREHIDEYRF